MIYLLFMICNFEISHQFIFSCFFYLFDLWWPGRFIKVRKKWKIEIIKSDTKICKVDYNREPNSGSTKKISILPYCLIAIFLLIKPQWKVQKPAQLEKLQKLKKIEHRQHDRDRDRQSRQLLHTIFLLYFELLKKRVQLLKLSHIKKFQVVVIYQVFVIFFFSVL